MYTIRRESDWYPWPVDCWNRRAWASSRWNFREQFVSPLRIQKSTISCSNTTTFRHDSGCGDRSYYRIRGIFSEKNSFPKVKVYNFVLEHYSFWTDSGCWDHAIQSCSTLFFREKLESRFQKFPKSINFPDQARQRGSIFNHPRSLLTIAFGKTQIYYESYLVYGRVRS